MPVSPSSKPGWRNGCWIPITLSGSPTVKHYGDYHLCFRVAEEGNGHSIMFFMPKGHGYSVGQQGDTQIIVVKDRDLPSMEFSEAESPGKPKVAVEFMLSRK